MVSEKQQFVLSPFPLEGGTAKATPSYIFGTYDAALVAQVERGLYGWVIEPVELQDTKGASHAA